MDAEFINLLSLLLSAYTLGLLSAMHLYDYLESRDRKRLKADEVERQREIALVHRLHSIEVQ